jgi:hypothetical protein
MTQSFTDCHHVTDGSHEVDSEPLDVWLIITLSS